MLNNMGKYKESTDIRKMFRIGMGHTGWPMLFVLMLVQNSCDQNRNGTDGTQGNGAPGMYTARISGQPGTPEASPPHTAPRTGYCITNTRLRERPGPAGKAVAQLRVGARLEKLSDSAGWVWVKTVTGITGYVEATEIAAKWIKVWKNERTLLLMEGQREIRRYPIALGFNALDDKVQQGGRRNTRRPFLYLRNARQPQASRTLRGAQLAPLLTQS